MGGRLWGFRGRWEGGYGGRGSGREVIGGRGRLWGGGSKEGWWERVGG